ncbi:MAG TPA: transglutaminase family protein [Dehalococcoidia bacterium]|nr:transglutaminase family protein [Dehalococcoidia bacterium]
MQRYLNCTYTIDCEEESVKEKAQILTMDQETTVDRAKALFYFVRDGIKYNPYVPLYTLEDNRASITLKRGEGYCVQKAILLAALARASGIPTKLGFADIRNYIIPKKLADAMRGENLFIYHGYVSFYLDRKWVKATPAFDLKMCKKNRIIPVDFDGRSDAQFHRYNREGKLHIEYVQDHGYFDDLPWEGLLEARAGRY